MSNKKIERISDDQLLAQMNAVRAHMRRTRKHGGDTRDAEIELCYLEREEEHRENASMAHKNYLEELQEKRKDEAREAREEEEALLDYLGNDFEEVDD